MYSNLLPFWAPEAMAENCCMLRLNIAPTEVADLPAELHFRVELIDMSLRE